MRVLVISFGERVTVVTCRSAFGYSIGSEGKGGSGGAGYLFTDNLMLSERRYVMKWRLYLICTEFCRIAMGFDPMARMT